MSRQIATAANQIESAVSREQLLDILPAGGARNAVDCALWDLEAQHAERSVWNIVGVDDGPLDTVMTVGLETDPAAMADKAASAPEFRVIKVKLDVDRPVERVQAVRGAARCAIDRRCQPGLESGTAPALRACTARARRGVHRAAAAQRRGRRARRL